MLNIILISLIPIPIIIINIIILKLNWKNKKKNMLQTNIINNILKKIKNYKYESSIIDIISTNIINYLFYIVEFPENILRICFKTKYRKELFGRINLISLIDIFVFIKMVLSIIFYFCFNNLIVIGYYIWRLLEIIFNKLAILNGIDFHHIKKNKLSKDSNISSFNRFLILQFISLIEIIFSFSYLFYYFDVFKINNKISTLLNFFISFVTFNYDVNSLNDCSLQIFLIILSISAYIIFIILLLANIFNLKYKNWDDT